jgi:hypothetical protein
MLAYTFVWIVIFGSVFGGKACLAIGTIFWGKACLAIGTIFGISGGKACLAIGTIFGGKACLAPMAAAMQYGFATLHPLTPGYIFMELEDIC